MRSPTFFPSLLFPSLFLPTPYICVLATFTHTHSHTQMHMQMQDIFGSVRRSLVFRASPENEDPSLGGTLVDKINSCIRKSRVFSKPSPASPPLPPIPKDPAPMIRWRKGELIGCGAFGRVYMGMNLDSGELLAVKQVSSSPHSPISWMLISVFEFSCRFCNAINFVFLFSLEFKFDYYSWNIILSISFSFLLGF